jgi:FkbM family methyltransferase
VPDLRFRDLVKIFLRSRSLGLTRDMARQVRSKSLQRIRWNGHKVFYRPGTTDPFVLHQVLLKTGRKAEYYLPPNLQPDVILDIGSNIGASILYFHRRFPKARIIGFEPHPETFRILETNVSHISSVSVFNYGLGHSNMWVTVPSESVNFGAFSTKGRSRNRSTDQIDCQVRRIDDVLRDLDIQKVDLIKIDCEGAEADVFAAMPPEILTQCQWMVGELHDDTGFELLARLAPQFRLDLKKKMFSPLFRFHACNVADAARLKGKFDTDALQR